MDFKADERSTSWANASEENAESRHCRTFERVRLALLWYTNELGKKELEAAQSTAPGNQ